MNAKKEIISFISASFLLFTIFGYFIYLNQVHRIHCGNYKRMRKREKIRKEKEDIFSKIKFEKEKDMKKKIKDEFEKNPSNFYSFKEEDLA